MEEGRERGEEPRWSKSGTLPKVVESPTGYCVMVAILPRGGLILKPPVEKRSRLD
jgi:hypothetical protein